MTIADKPALGNVIAAIAEGASERDRSRQPPYHAFDLIRQAHIGALRVPVAEGGGGASLADLFALVIDLGAADPNVAQSLRNHFGFVEMRLISAKDGTKDRWLDEVVKGSLFGLVGTELTTVSLGTRDQFKTTLERKGDGFLLNGLKYYSTGAVFADFVGFTAVLDGDVVTAVVPANRAGVIFEDDWDGIGQRVTASGTTRLVDVNVGPDEILSHSFSQSTFFQLWLTAVIAGILRNIVGDAVSVLHQRGDRTFGHASAPRPADDPILQQVVGQISSEAFAARLLILACAERLDSVFAATGNGTMDQTLAHEAALCAAKAKVVIDEFALRSATRLFDVGGASATKQIANLDRHWRNIRTLVSHNPASYKARAIGEYETNGRDLPATGFF